MSSTEDNASGKPERFGFSKRQDCREKLRKDGEEKLWDRDVKAAGLGSCLQLENHDADNLGGGHQHMDRQRILLSAVGDQEIGRDKLPEQENGIALL